MFSKRTLLTATIAILGLELLTQKLPAQAGTLAFQPTTKAANESLLTVKTAPAEASNQLNQIANKASKVALGDSAEAALATYLKQSGVKMYGSSNCFYTLLQLQMFGAQSFDRVPYVECKNGKSSICQTANIKSTPTWEIDGRLYHGIKSLQQLAQLSGYQGTVSFQQAASGN